MIMILTVAASASASLVVDAAISTGFVGFVRFVCFCITDIASARTLGLALTFTTTLVFNPNWARMSSRL